MTYALPAAAPPPPKRQVLVGTAVACAALLAFTGGLLGLYLSIRRRVFNAGTSWVPSDVVLPEVPANVMLVTVVTIPLFAQWASWAGRRQQRAYVALALGVCGLFAAAALNAQMYLYTQVEMPAQGDGSFPTMFWAVTGALVVVVIIGLLYSVVAAFRALGGRRDSELLAGHALYWYVASIVTAAIWYAVYVTK